MLFKRMHVNKDERVIICKSGRLASILTPGTYWLIVWPMMSLETEVHDLSTPIFRSRWEDHLLREHANTIAAHFTVIETTDSEIAMIFIEGSLYQVLLPGKRVLFWKDAACVSSEIVSIIDLDLPEWTLAPLEQADQQAEIDYLFSEP